jgi:hypothetical protein
LQQRVFSKYNGTFLCHTYTNDWYTNRIQ